MLLRGAGGWVHAGLGVAPALPLSLTAHSIFDIHTSCSYKKPPKHHTHVLTSRVMRRRNYFLPDDLVHELQLVAQAKNTTVSDVIRKALEAWLTAYKRKQEAQNGR